MGCQEQQGRNIGGETGGDELSLCAVDRNVTVAGTFQDMSSQARDSEGAHGGREPAEGRETVAVEDAADDEALQPGAWAGGNSSFDRTRADVPAATTEVANTFCRE